MPIVTRQKPLPVESYIGRGPIGLYRDIVGAWLESHEDEIVQAVVNDISENILDIIPDGSIANVKLADNTIEGDKIKDGTIEIDDLDSTLADFFKCYIVGYARIGSAKTM